MLINVKYERDKIVIKTKCPFGEVVNFAPDVRAGSATCTKHCQYFGRVVSDTNKEYIIECNHPETDSNKEDK